MREKGDVKRKTRDEGWEGVEGAGERERTCAGWGCVGGVMKGVS